MTIRERKRLFYGLLIAFVILGGGVIFYSQGWRVDFSTFRFDKVGAIYVRSFPKNAAIFLDDKTTKNDAGFFQSGTLVNGLFPKSYDLKLQASGYEPWEETIAVLPSLVTEVKYAVLIPKTVTVIATGTALRNFWMLDNALTLQDASNNILMNGERIAKGDLAGWNDSLTTFLLFDEKKKAYIYQNLETKTSNSLAATFAKLGFSADTDRAVLLDPSTGDVIVHNQKSIALIDAVKGKNTVLDSATSKKGLGGSFIASKFFFAWSEYDKEKNRSTIVIYDKFLKNPRLDLPTAPGRNVKLAWGGNNELGILEDDGELFTYRIAGNNIQKVADDVRDFKFSNDGNSLAAVEHKSLEIFDSNEKENYRRFNVPDVENIKDIVWFKDKFHLFLVYDDRALLLDFGDKALRNLRTIAPAGKIYYDDGVNRLYYLFEGREVREMDLPQ